VPAGALNTIYRTVVGWDSITNAAPGVLGTNAENRADFERRRALSVAGNATGIIPAIRGAVLSVPGIVDAYVTENDTDAPVTIGGQTLIANSIYVAVEGGASADIGRAIWTKKPPGIPQNGTTTVTVLDTESGYDTPPSYTIKFQRATALAINFDIELTNSLLVPGDAANQIQAVLISAFPSQARIGQAVYASSFVCAIAALGSWVKIRSIEVNGGEVQDVGIGEFPTLGTVTVTVV
jgi:hypothetical protein